MGMESEWVELHFSSYQFTNAQSLYGDCHFTSLHGKQILMAVASGEGEAYLNGQAYKLARGHLMLFPTGCEVSIVSGGTGKLHIYTLEISILAPNACRQSEIMARTEAIHVNEGMEMVHLAEKLYIHRRPVEELRHIKNQMMFHQLLYCLLERLQAEQIGSAGWSMEQSIDYLEKNFSEKISRSQLAAATRVSVSHYSVLFKQLTGYSPNEYLTRLRIHRAIELLLDSEYSLRDIAFQTGYKDEFYLSRRFKQYTGRSPSSRLARQTQRLATLNPPYTSHLILLGIEPTTAVLDSNEYVSTGDVAAPKSMLWMSEDCTAEQLKKALLDTKTELVIASDPLFNHLKFDADKLRIAAPIVTVPWMDQGWQDHFRQIASLVQKSEQAERWLAEFRRNEDEARKLVRNTDVANETITILVIKPKGLFAYGARNAGYVLYRSLGLKPPQLIQEQIDKHGDRFHSLPLELSDLHEVDGDRMIVILFSDEKGSTAHADDIFQSSAWRELAAVRKNQVYIVDQNDWIPYNPVSISYQLRRAVSLFTSDPKQMYNA